MLTTARQTGRDHRMNTRQPIAHLGHTKGWG